MGTWKQARSSLVSLIRRTFDVAFLEGLWQRRLAARPTRVVERVDERSHGFLLSLGIHPRVRRFRDQPRKGALKCRTRWERIGDSA